MTTQDVRAMLRISEWQTLESRNTQVVFLCEFGETDATYMQSTDDIARIFNIIVNNVHQIRHKAHLKQKSPHRPLTLDAEQEADIVRFIRHQIERQNDVTQRASSSREKDHSTKS
jgi:uncharacterized protein YfbU (UPF0304 family)